MDASTKPSLNSLDDIHASNDYFKALLSTIPMDRVYDETTVETIKSEISSKASSSGLVVGQKQKPESLKDKFREKLDQFKVKRTKIERTKMDDQEKKREKRKLQKQKLKDKRKKMKTMPKVQLPASSLVESKILSKPVFNEKGRVLYSNLVVNEEGRSKKKAKRGLPTGKNFKGMLEKVEKRKEKLSKLEEKDTDAAKMLKEKFKWKTAIAKAEGVKVKDNARYLKTAQKKKEKRKVKSGDEWTERGKRLETKMKKVQDKRKENINRKKKARMDKKIKSAKKRGRVVF